jgi:hypothetical protein
MHETTEDYIKYGAKVVIRDRSVVDGQAGIVVKIREGCTAEVLLDKEIIWPVKLEALELAS